VNPIQRATREADHFPSVSPALGDLRRTRAQNLRTDAAAVPDQFAALSATGAGELAALKNLRAHLAGMQQLLAQHAGQAAAARIRAVDYRR
jgi:uncharacterized protein involved in exopolysaccharide biosynthesis